MNWFEAALRWYGVLVLLTWGWAPLIRLLSPRLADRGMLVVRPLALLGVVYPSWLLAGSGLLPYSSTGLWVTLAVGAIVGWGVAIRRGIVGGAWLRSLLIAEVVSLAAFAGYLWLRGFTPAILGTEKPMDAALLASSRLTATIPPPDPWFAGESINYYYLGYLLNGALARMAGVVATTGFNLALATTFSMALCAAAGLGFDAARPWFSRGRAVVAAALAAFLLVLAGNLYAAVQLSRTPAATLAADWWDKGAGVGWRASRIVCDGPRVANDCPAAGGRVVETINEFPFFSFLLGDLHPHVMALPLTLATLALGLNLLLASKEEPRDRARSTLRLAVTGAVVGALYVANSWDLPTFVVLTGAALWFGRSRIGGGTERRGRGRALITLVVAAVLPWLPFWLRYDPPNGIGAESLPGWLAALPIVPSLLGLFGVYGGPRTSVAEYLTIFGLPYLFGVWLIASGLLGGRGGGRTVPRAVLAPSRSAIIFALLTALVAVLLPAPVLLLGGVPLAGGLVVLNRDREISTRSIATGLYVIGFALSIVVELFYLRDLFDSRMNTLFKAYYQVWTLFALGAALAVVTIWAEARPRWAARPALTGVALAMLAAVTVYPVLASSRWTEGFADWQGLDGIAYLDQRAPGEAAAIRWLQGEIEPGDVVLEAAGCSYRPGGDVPLSRVSAFTGGQTVIGWGSDHERQWRDGQPDLLPEVAIREDDVRRLFADPRGALLDRYGVAWLILGRYETGDWSNECRHAGPYEGIERPGYPGPGWRLAFAADEVRLYRRVDKPEGMAGDDS